MGIRVTAQTLLQQLEYSGQLGSLQLPYHQGIVTGELPLSIGGGIGQSRTLMLLLRKAHLGEVSVSVWPKILTDMCAARKRLRRPTGPSFRYAACGSAGATTKPCRTEWMPSAPITTSAAHRSGSGRVAGRNAPLGAHRGFEPSHLLPLPEMVDVARHGKCVKRKHTRGGFNVPQEKKR